MRDERGRQSFLRAKHLEHGITIPRPQRQDLAHLRVAARGGDTCRRRRRRLALRPRDERPRCANRAHHDGSRRDVADVRQLELHGAIEEAALERVDVSATESLCDGDGNRRAPDRRAHQRRILRRARQHDEQPNQATTDGIAEPIEADVDDRLRRALVLRRDRREENLVARLEERASKGRFAGSRHERATESGKHQSTQSADNEGQRRRGCRDREPELLEHQRRRDTLHDERHQTHAGVVEREELQQRIATAERLDCFHLEHVVDERRGDGAQQDKRGQVSKVRRIRQHAETGSR